MLVFHPSVAMLIASDRQRELFDLAQSEREVCAVSGGASPQEIPSAPVGRAWLALKALLVAVALAAGLLGAGQAVFADEPLAPVPEEILRGNHSGVVLPLPADVDDVADAGESLAPVPQDILHGNHSEAFADVASAEVNLPPSSRADYRGVEPVVAGQ